MKRNSYKILFLIFILGSSKLAEATNQRRLVNRSACVVHGPERSRIFTTLSYERRGIDGRQRLLPDLISDELIYQDALHAKIPIDDAVVNAHLRRVLQNFGLKPGDENMIFAQEGYTPEEGMEQFKVMYGVNAMTEHRVMQHLMITEEDVVAYYKAHPIIKEPTFLLQGVLVPFVTNNPEDKLRIAQQVDTFIKTGQGLSVSWSDAYWLKQSEMAAPLKPLQTMEIGSVLHIEMGKGIQLYRLVNKKNEREVPLAKRYKKIVEILRRPKFEELFQKYRKALLENATVVYLQ